MLGLSTLPEGWSAAWADPGEGNRPWFDLGCRFAEWGHRFAEETKSRVAELRRTGTKLVLGPDPNAQVGMLLRDFRAPPRAGIAAALESLGPDRHCGDFTVRQVSAAWRDCANDEERRDALAELGYMPRNMTTSCATTGAVLTIQSGIRTDLGLAIGRVTRCPDWDRDRGELRLSGTLLKQIGVAEATNVVWFLDQFQESGWPDRVEVPDELRRRGADCLHQTLKSLNTNLKWLRSSAEGGAEWVTRKSVT